MKKKGVPIISKRNLVSSVDVSGTSPELKRALPRPESIRELLLNLFEIDRMHSSKFEESDKKEWIKFERIVCMRWRHETEFC